MREDEQEEGESRPEPADLDEVDVEDVTLFGEVAGCLLRDIGLREGVVGRVAAGGVEAAEEGAEEERCWVDYEEDGFEGGGEEG